MSNENLSALLSLKVVNVPWPIRIRETTVAGRLGVNRICETKCSEKTCWKTSSSSIGTVCPLGLTVYEVLLEDQKIKIFGVVGPSFKEKLPSHRDYKDACKGRSVGPNEVQAWLAEIRALLSLYDESQKQALGAALEPLHDAMRLARDISQLADRLINEGTGKTPNERFENATETQKALTKSAELLVDTFDLLEVYLNPEAAKFGQLRTIEIYKLLDKLCKIASIAREQQIRPRARIEGHTRRAFDLFESFKLIPFCLIDNAQKYSRRGGVVTVRVSEIATGVLVEVESEGPKIPDSEREKIFLRGYRGEVAIRAHPSGMGVGLYVSDIVARAHGTRIKVASTNLNYQVGGVEQARNVFSFEVRNGAPNLSSKLNKARH